MAPRPVVTLVSRSGISSPPTQGSVNPRGQTRGHGSCCDPPVVGSFDQNGVGHFFGKDTLNGKPILVVFRWDARNKDRPVWGQAFSPDNGKTWEWNFFNVSERPKE